MKRLLILIWFIPSLLWAAPSVSTVVGTTANGEKITISGSGFGSTGPTVQFFDDMELGTNNSRIGNGDSTNAQVGEWRDLSSRGMNNYPTFSTLAAHSGTKAFRLNHAEAADCGSSGVWGGPSTTAASAWYFSFWTFLPSGQAVPGTTDCGGAGANWKVWWLTTDDYFQNDYSSEIITDPPTETSLCWVDGSQTRECWGWGAFSFTKGRWIRWEVYLSGSTSSGAGSLWFTDSGQARHLVGSISGRTLDDGTTGWGYLHFPGFGRYDSNSNTYYDDIYVATGSGARARVEIGNNATYTSCTNLAVCTPTSWADTSIEATVRAGSFTEGTAYLFVTDSSGVTSAGKEITFGGGSSSPAPPTLSNVTISNGRVQ